MKKFLLSIFAVMLAVFSVQAEEVTYTVTSTSAVSVSGDIPEGSSATYKSTYTDKCQLTKGNSMTLTLSGYAGCKITGIKLSMKSNTSKGKGSFSAVVGSTTISSIQDSKFNTSSWAGKWSTSYINVTPNMTVADYVVGDNENVVVTIAATENSLYCQSFTITYEPVEGGGEGGGTPEPEPEPEPEPGEPETPEVVEGNTVTFTASANGYSNGDEVSTVKIDDYITATFGKGTNSNTPKYYTTGSAIRCYGGNNFTIASTAGNITKITLTFGSGDGSNTITTNVGTYENSIWTGTAREVTFAIGGASGHRKVAGIEVTYEGTGTGAPVVENVIAPVISSEKTEYATGEEAVVTITTSTGGATIYYSLDGSEPTTEYTGEFTLSETTTVKAIAKKEGANDSPITEKTFTFKNVVTLVNATVADVIAAYESGDEITKGATVVGYIVGTIDGSAISKAVFGTDVETLSNILLADDPNETNIENCIPVNLPTGSVRNALNLVDNKENYKKKVVLTGSVEAYFTVAGLKNTSAYEFIPEVENESYTLTVGETEWATLYLDFAVTIPDGVEVWTVSEIVDGYVVLGEVLDVIPAGCPVLVKASMSGEWDFEYTAKTGNEYVNLLQGTATATYITDDAYVLTKDDTSETGVCFGRAIKNQLENTAWLNNANKAYLPASAVPAAAQGAASFSFRFPGTTAIENVEVENASNVIYDLTGRKVETISAPGIYIVGGKKVLVK